MTRLLVSSRALSYYRIAFGSILLLDLARWSGDLPFFVAPNGPLPLGSLAADSAGGAQAWSLYNASCYGFYPYLLFLVTVLAAMAMTIGWHSRAACGLLLPLLLSLQNRAAVALDRADILELTCLLTGVFLPWDQLLALRPAKPAASRLAALAPGAVLLLQALLWQEQAFKACSDGASTGWCLLLTLAPLPLLASRNRLRFLALLAPAGVFLSRLPTNELLPWFGLVGLLPWLGVGFTDEPAQSRGRARWGVAALFLALAAAVYALGHALVARPELTNARAFLALGPRAPDPPPDSWLAMVARATGNGNDWNALDPTHPVSFARPEHPFASQSYRQGLYLGSLQLPGNWGLRYWLAYSFYNRERRRLGQVGPSRIEVYRCTEASGAPSAILFSRWPMRD